MLGSNCQDGAVKYQYVLLNHSNEIFYPRPSSISVGIKRQWHFSKHFGSEYKQSVVSPELWLQLRRENSVLILDTDTSNIAAIKISETEPTDLDSTQSFERGTKADYEDKE